MEAKLTRLTHKIAIQLHIVAESCTTCSSRSRRPVPKLLDTSSCVRNCLVALPEGSASLKPKRAIKHDPEPCPYALRPRSACHPETYLLDLTYDRFPRGFLTKIVYKLLLSLILTTCQARSRISCLCNIRTCSVTPTFLVPNIFLNTLLTNTCTLYYCLKVDHV
jgi:hypothetical protein